MLKPYIYTPKVLPAVYEEAMSYYQQLEYVFTELTGLQKHLNKFIIDIAEYLNSHENDYMDYTDKKISLIENNINEIEKGLNRQITALETILKNQYQELTLSIENNKDEIYRDMDLLENEFSNSISKLYSSLFSLQTSISNDFMNLKSDLEKVIYDMASNQTGNTIIVKNPVEGKLSSLNAALKSLYEFIQAYTCLTVKEYDDLKITVEEYDKRQITFLNFNSRSYLIFLNDIIYKKVNQKLEELSNNIEKLEEKLNEKNRVYNLITNDYTTPEVYMNSIADRTYLGVTVNEYEKMMEINQFDKYNTLNITVEEYQKEIIARYILEIMKVKKLAAGNWNIYFSYGFGIIKMTMVLNQILLDIVDIDIDFSNELGILLTNWNKDIYDNENNIIDLWYKKNINNNISGSLPKEAGKVEATMKLNIYFYYGGIKYERNIKN